MQYMMTGVVIVIISGLVIHLIALAIEGLYKVISNRTTWRFCGLPWPVATLR